MKIERILNLEELAQFGLSIILFNLLDYPWWIFALLLFAPDISILGYLINTRLGAFFYNLFHNKLIGILIYIIGFYTQIPFILLSGIILFGHAAFDRFLGYGLKYDDDFKNTHLGYIGKKSESTHLFKK